MSILFGMLFTTNVTGWMLFMIKMPNNIPIHMHFNCSLYVVYWRKCIELVTSSWVVLQWYQNKDRRGHASLSYFWYDNDLGHLGTFCMTRPYCFSLFQQFNDVGKEEMRICEKLVHDQHLQHQGWAAVIANLEDITRYMYTNDYGYTLIW